MLFRESVCVWLGCIVGQLRVLGMLGCGLWCWLLLVNVRGRCDRRLGVVGGFRVEMDECCVMRWFALDVVRVCRGRFSGWRGLLVVLEKRGEGGGDVFG